jgi:hypothetical protein
LTQRNRFVRTNHGWVERLRSRSRSSRRRSEAPSSSAMGSEAAAWPNTNRYVPPDIGLAWDEVHAKRLRWPPPPEQLGLVHASNTMRAGPLKVRLMTSSGSEITSTVVEFFAVSDRGPQ